MTLKNEFTILTGECGVFFAGYERELLLDARNYRHSSELSLFQIFLR